MPVNAASKSINLPEKIAEKHNVQFLVYSRLAAPGIEALNKHLDKHLHFTEPLIKQGIMPISGPFFTESGENTGNGFYVLRVDNIQEARRITEQDPLHKAGIRTHTVEPWLQVMS